MNYQIQIAVEKRSPVIKTAKIYVGRVEYETLKDEDGEEYQNQIWPDEADPAAWEDRSYVAEDRRTPFTETGNLYCISEVLGPEYLTDDNLVMVAEWDLQAPYVTVHKGDYSKRNLHFGGWPVMAKEQFDEMAVTTPAA